MVPFRTLNLSTSAAIVVGTTLSAKNIVYAENGNSNQWNSTFTTVQSNSASWEINNLDGGNSISIYLANQKINGGVANTF